MVPEQNKPELTREPAAESKPESLSSYLNSRSAFSHSQDPQLKSSFNPMSASRQSCPADLACPSWVKLRSGAAFVESPFDPQTTDIERFVQKS
jgi:hypothetical protein